MKSASSNEQQFALQFRLAAGLPFAVSPRRICRAAKRAFVAHPAAKGWPLREYLEDVALLAELRRRYRLELRAWGRAGQRGSAAAFACTPQGRRAHRVMEALSCRIAAEQAKLCG